MRLLAWQTFVETLAIYSALAMYLLAGQITLIAMGESMFQVIPTQFRLAI